MQAIHAFGDDSVLFQDFTGGILITMMFRHNFLPFGKTDGAASSALPRVRGNEPQLHPWRLEAAAPSIFATMGLTGVCFGFAATSFSFDRTCLTDVSRELCRNPDKVFFLDTMFFVL